MYTTLCYIAIYLQTLINDDEHADGGGHAVGRTLNKIISHDHICTLHLRI